MFEYGRLIRCQQRKDELLAQSAGRRVTLMTEAQNLRSVAGWVDLGVAVAGKVRTVWSVLAPLVPLWQTRKQEPSGLIHKLAAAIAIARSIMEVWKRRG